MGNAALPVLRIGVEKEGPCLLTTGALASAFSLPAEQVRNALDSGGFALSRQGAPVACAAVTNGLVFFGQASSSVDSRQTVYHLAFGGGLALGGEDHAADGVEAAVSPVSLVPFTRRLESNDWCSIQLDSRMGDGWMCWQFLRPFSSYSYPCSMPGYEPTGMPVRLTVALRSLYPESDADTHLFSLAFNGQALGAVTWAGQRAFVWETNLPAGTVSGPSGGPLNVSEMTGAMAGRGALDWIELRYSRPALADSGRVLWQAESGDPVIAAGFPEAPAVWDVTEPDHPAALAGLVSVPRAGGFACGFLPSPGRRYAAFSASGLLPPASIRLDERADLGSTTNAADWVAVLPPRELADFRSAVQGLADFRSAQGLRTRLVTAEAIADTFGGGVLDTNAIRWFVAATAGWSVRPQSVVLAGFGSVDYRLESAVSRNLLPTPGVPVEFPSDRLGEIVSADASYGDDNGDGVPEVVVGRIPARTQVELDEAIAKIKHFEAVAAGKSGALFTADNPTVGISAGFNLHVSSDAAAADAAAGGFSPVKVYVPSTETDSYSIRGPVMAALSNGPSFILHLGHGDAYQIGAGYGILHTNSVGKTQFWDWPAIALLPSCQINRFHHPSMPETFCQQSVRLPAAGFAAIWAPSCRVTTADGILLGREMVKAWAGDAPLRLGEAVRLAASRSRPQLETPAILECVTLLGDPATVIRLGRSARDVPASWLADKGLTAPNAEESDADGDSFPAWVEYFQGSDPLVKSDHPLRINRVAPASDRLALRFVSGPGGRYRILQSQALGLDQVWLPSPVAESPAAGWDLSGGWLTATGLETTVYVPAGGGAQFFKVEAAP
jgi:hypothetical protein